MHSLWKAITAKITKVIRGEGHGGALSTLPQHAGQPDEAVWDKATVCKLKDQQKICPALVLSIRPARVALNLS
jgi:hypothetical protein